MKPDVIVTNFNPRYTGVSSTAAAVMRQLQDRYAQALCDIPLPGCPTPISKREAFALSRTPPKGVMVWHVRRNYEMQVAIIARDWFKLPIRTVFTSAAQHRHSAWPRWLISKMDAVISTSEVAGALVPNTTVIVPHGVDTELFQPAPDRAAAWAATGYPGKRGIANIGRLRADKGTDVFVHAMIPLLKADPDLVAVSFGRARPKDAAFLAGLKAEIAEAGLTDRLIFPGEVPAEQLAKLLPAFSLLVACPRYEPFGMTVLEGMACGLPFVGSETGAFRMVSDGERAGRIVPLGDAPAVTQAASALLNDPDTYARAAEAARDLAVNRFSIEHEAAAVAKIYDSLLAQGPR